MDNELIKQESWWKRNWKWFVPVSGCLAFLILLIVFVGGIIFSVTTAFKESEPYQYALEKANKDEYIVEVMGSPIEQEGMVSGNYKWNDGEKSADFRIPIEGPKGAGTLVINATGDEDSWTYHKIMVILDKTQEQVDLLADEGD